MINCFHFDPPIVTVNFLLRNVTPSGTLERDKDTLDRDKETLERDRETSERDEETLERDKITSPSGSFTHKSIYDNVSLPAVNSPDMENEVNGENHSDEGGNHHFFFHRLLDYLNC